MKFEVNTEWISIPVCPRGWIRRQDEAITQLVVLSGSVLLATAKTLFVFVFYLFSAVIVVVVTSNVQFTIATCLFLIPGAVLLGVMWLQIIRVLFRMWIPRYYEFDSAQQQMRCGVFRVSLYKTPYRAFTRVTVNTDHKGNRVFVSISCEFAESDAGARRRDPLWYCGQMSLIIDEELTVPTTANTAQSREIELYSRVIGSAIARLGDAELRVIRDGQLLSAL